MTIGAGQLGGGLAALAALVAIASYMVRVTRVIAAKAEKENVSEKFRDVYQRIDKVKDQYVRRDDLTGHMKHLEQSVERIERNQEEMNKAIMKLIENIGHS
jgi:3-hydroxyacyl-CoA dehydrogenase